MAKANDKIDEAVAAARETTVPLLIRRRCTPHQQAVWLAISFLLKTHPRADFGLREIAQEAGLTAVPRVSGWIDDLVALGLLEQEKPEELQPGKRDNFSKIRSKYAIPWKTILEESLNLAEDYVRHQVQGGNRLRTTSASVRAEQQSLFGAHVSEGSHEGVSDRIQGGVSEGSHEGVSDRIQDCDRSITVSCDPSDTHGWMDGMDRRMDGSAPPPRKRAGPGRPPTIPPPPSPELYAAHPSWAVGGPLPAHPRELWASACPAPTVAHDRVLEALAAEHDLATDGQGWYWVGRAILAGLHAEDQLGHPSYIRNTMKRWQAEDSYGSDRPDWRPKETPNGIRSRSVGPGGGRGRAARPASHQPSRPGLGVAGDAGDDLSPEELAAAEEAAYREAQRRRGG